MQFLRDGCDLCLLFFFCYSFVLVCSEEISRSQLLHSTNPHLCFSKRSFLVRTPFLHTPEFFFITRPESGFHCTPKTQKLSFCEQFVEKCKKTLGLIAFQLSAVSRSFNALKAVDQNMALWIDF